MDENDTKAHIKMLVYACAVTIIGAILREYTAQIIWISGITTLYTISLWDILRA